MRHLDQVTGTPSPPVSPAGPGYARQHGIAGLALVLIAALPVVVWSSNGSTGDDPPESIPVIRQTGVTGPDENERPVIPAASPQGDGKHPAEVAVDQASSGEYDLALGKSVFNHTCLTCHGTSVRDAPRVGDMHAWQHRLTQGLDVLIRHALDGHGRMPAKGGYTTLTDNEVSSAVAYVYQTGKEIMAEQDKSITQAGCGPMPNIDQCSPAELRNLLVLQMLWLLSGPRQ